MIFSHFDTKIICQQQVIHSLETGYIGSKPFAELHQFFLNIADEYAKKNQIVFQNISFVQDPEANANLEILMKKSINFSVYSVLIFMAKIIPFLRFKVKDCIMIDGEVIKRELCQNNELIQEILGSDQVALLY